jgi:predicted peptidase
MSSVLRSTSLLLVVLGTGCFSADPSRKLKDMPAGTGFTVRSLNNSGRTHNYGVFLPRDYSPSRKYPAIVFLHGIGESGNDGKKCTTVGIGPAIAKRNGDFPFVVVFPQNGFDWTSDESGKLVIDVLDDAKRQYSIDADRITLSGLSSGGKGTWVLGARYYDTWNALVPMGGYSATGSVRLLKDMPIWALHNSGDFVVSVGNTREMVDLLKAQGASNLHYTEYDAIGHNCWDAAYDSGELFEWLQQQRRSTRPRRALPSVHPRVEEERVMTGDNQIGNLVDFSH